MRALKNISLIFLFCIVVGLADKTKSQELIAPKEQNQTITTHFDTNKLADAIADRFISAMQNRNYSFLVEDKLESLRKEIYDFAAKYPPTQMSPAKQEVLLAAIDRYVPDNFLNRGFDFPGDFTRDFDIEGAYLKFRDQINTFKWKLWLVLIRKTPTQSSSSNARYSTIGCGNLLPTFRFVRAIGVLSMSRLMTFANGPQHIWNKN